MSSLYFEQTNGISGDMAVAALLNIDNNFEYLKKRLALLKLRGFSVEYQTEQRNGITGGRFIVHSSNVAHTTRTFKNIASLIEASSLTKEEKQLSMRIFQRIAEAESAVHNLPVEEVHFHEVGAIDSIIDIVSFAILFTAKHIDKCFASWFHLGIGETKSLHGTIPIPAPATLELVKNLPVRGTNKHHELTTPTGAGIITTIANQFGVLPPSRIVKFGLGFGSRKEDGINGLRVFEIQLLPGEVIHSTAETLIAVIETTIDDSTPEEIAHLHQQLFDSGARDVFITPILMKKGRPGFNISALVEPQSVDSIKEILLNQSSTFGIRFYYAQREVLNRRIEQIDTDYGTVGVKVGLKANKILKLVPEYEDCARIARITGKPLRKVYEMVIEKASNRFYHDKSNKNR